MLLLFFDEQSHECKDSEAFCDTCRFMPSFFQYDISRETELVLKFLLGQNVSDDVLMKILRDEYQHFQLDLCRDVLGILKTWSVDLIHDFISFLITKSLIKPVHVKKEGVPVMTLSVSQIGHNYISHDDFMRPLYMMLPTEANYLLRKNIISEKSLNN